jgi:hypothetical protein
VKFGTEPINFGAMRTLIDIGRHHCKATTVTEFDDRVEHERQEIMEMNRIGKFEMRQIVKDFDATLIRLFGVNMLDADISRVEAINAYNDFHCPHKAAEYFGRQRGFSLQTA